MKKIFFLTVAALMSVATMAQDPEHYCALTNEGQTLTLYYDANRSSFETTFYSPAGLSSTQKEAVTKVVIDPSYADARPTSIAYWFSDYSAMTEIEGMEYFNTSEVTNMSNLFEDCSSLESIDLSHFNTGKVTNMSGMFWVCNSLTALNLSAFNTSAVTDMNYMFANCYGLTTLDLSGFNTEKVTNMSGMFERTGLTALDLSSFNTAAVTDMSYMFEGNNNLASINLTGFNTANVTDMQSMFEGCYAVTTLDLSSFNVEKVTSLYEMFKNCLELTSLNIAHFNPVAANTSIEMFYMDQKLATIYCNNDWSTCTGLTESTSVSMFWGCSLLKGENGTEYDTANTKVSYAHIDVAGNPGYFTHKDIETALDQVPSDHVQGTKILRDGQLFILRDGKTYDARGTRVQ